MKPFLKTPGLYCKSEMAWMPLVYRIKHIIFYPLLWLFSKIGLNATILSILSGCVAVASIYISIKFNSPKYFIYGIWLHLFIDALDGTLARFENKVSPKGVIFDFVADQLGIIASSIYLIYFTPASPANVLIYTALYIFINSCSIVLSYINDPFYFVIRPRIFIFLALTIDYVWQTEISNLMVLIALSVSIIFSIIGAHKLLKHTNFLSS